MERILATKQREGDTDISVCAVDKKNTDKNVCVTALERKIDALVYALYGLTLEEIELVEGVR